MTQKEIEAKLYTVNVGEKDIICLHLEYEMSPDILENAMCAFSSLLRSRGIENPIVILQPGMALTTAKGVFENI